MLLDFTGWRYFELVETEGERVDRYIWPYSNQVYWIYREEVDFSHVGTLSLWLNGLPHDGQVQCRMSAIRALKLVQTRLIDPTIMVNGQPVVFPISLKSGSCLEFGGKGAAEVFDSNGALVGRAEPRGSVPALKAGGNRLEFTCRVEPSVNARARITLSAAGRGL